MRRRRKGWSEILGIAEAKRKWARKTGIPTTKQGRKRKALNTLTGGAYGRYERQRAKLHRMGCLLPCLVVLIFAIFASSAASSAAETLGSSAAAFLAGAAFAVSLFAAAGSAAAAFAAAAAFGLPDPPWASRPYDPEWPTSSGSPRPRPVFTLTGSTRLLPLYP